MSHGGFSEAQLFYRKYLEAKDRCAKLNLQHQSFWAETEWCL